MKIEVIALRVGKPLEVIEIENSIEAMQKFVGGCVEQLQFGHRLVILCDEDGNLVGKPPNRIWQGDVLVGDFLICRTFRGKWSSIEPTDIALVVPALTIVDNG